MPVARNSLLNSREVPPAIKTNLLAEPGELSEAKAPTGVRMAVRSLAEPHGMVIAIRA